jgi:hypothetical protein
VRASTAAAHALTLATVLAGNRAMERRAGGPRGLPRLTPFAATLHVYAVPFLWPRPDGRVSGCAWRTRGTRT